MFLAEGGGKSSFWKTAMPLLLPAALYCLHPVPCRGSQQEEIKQERAVKCNVLAMPNQHGLGQDRLQTAVGQPKICYNPEVSRAGTPDT